MFPRKFALFGGIIMLVIGLIALVAPGSAVGLPSLDIENSYGLFLNVFPMNVFSKVALIIFGCLGIMASREKYTSLPSSIHFSRWVFGVMGALAILGLFPQTYTLNGTWPLFGNQVWVNGIFALLGGYFGFAETLKMAKPPVLNEVRNSVRNTP